MSINYSFTDSYQTPPLAILRLSTPCCKSTCKSLRQKPSKVIHCIVCVLKPTLLLVSDSSLSFYLLWYRTRNSIKLGECSALWGECERVVVGGCIGSITTTHNVLHVFMLPACIVYMHNKGNLRFIKIHTVAVRVEHPAVSLSLCLDTMLCCLCYMSSLLLFSPLS